MKANELRIGNLYLNNGVVDKVSVGLLGYLEQNNPIGVDPIPLTEEWLIKAGFNKTSLEFANRYTFNGLCIFETFSMSKKREGFHASSHVDVNLTSIHQLQNLYFALTGEELLKTETWKWNGLA